MLGRSVCFLILNAAGHADEVLHVVLLSIDCKHACGFRLCVETIDGKDVPPQVAPESGLWSHPLNKSLAYPVEDHISKGVFHESAYRISQTSLPRHWDPSHVLIDLAHRP